MELTEDIRGVACEFLAETTPTPGCVRLVCRWEDRVAMANALRGARSQDEGRPYRLTGDPGSECRRIEFQPFGMIHCGPPVRWGYAIVTAYFGEPEPESPGPPEPPVRIGSFAFLGRDGMPLAAGPIIRSKDVVVAEAAARTTGTAERLVVELGGRDLPLRIRSGLFVSAGGFAWIDFDRMPEYRELLLAAAPVPDDAPIIGAATSMAAEPELSGWRDRPSLLGGLP